MITAEELRQLLKGDMAPPPEVRTPDLARVKRRAKSRRRLTAGLAAAALCAVTILGATTLRGSAPMVATEQCGGQIPVFGSIRPSMVGATPQPANAGSLSEITNAAGVLGESRYPESFAGVAMDTETDRVTVWRIYSPDFDRELRALPGQEKIVIRCADHSLRELLALMEKLVADGEYWQGQGLPVHRAGPRIDGSCVEIYSTDPPRWEAAFTAHYPGAPLCFLEGDYSVTIPWSS
jgi:hypothetical protein